MIHVASGLGLVGRVPGAVRAAVTSGVAGGVMSETAGQEMPVAATPSPVPSAQAEEPTHESAQKRGSFRIASTMAFALEGVWCGAT